jgi:hypothetical protein
MLPVGPASRRSSPQGKRPTSQAKPCRRGSRRRRASPLGVLKQPKVLGAWSEVWTYSRAGEVHSNLAGARDIERRAIPKCAMPAVPPPAWKLGFDQPCRSVNRACHMRGDRAKCTLELGCQVQASQRERSRLGTEVSSGPLFASAVGRRFELCSNLLSVVLMCGFSFMRLPTTSPTSCGRWRRRNL